MKKLSEIYKEQGIDFEFPIVIVDKGNRTYYEGKNGFCWKGKYDANGNRTYFENIDGFWYRYEYDADGNQTYYENSQGVKEGTYRSKSCNGKIIEVDGKKYKLTEL